MWQILMTVTGILAVAGSLWLVFRIHRFEVIKRIGAKSRVLSWLIAAIPVAAVGLFCFINVISFAIAMIHILLSFALCTFVSFVIGKIRKKPVSKDISGYTAAALAALYLAFGWFFAHHVFITQYETGTDKNIGKTLKIAAIADSHLGITLDGEDFEREMERLAAEKPDLLVIVGDYVDDDTKAEDMRRACRALGKLSEVCPVYYVFGNHDKGYFNSRDFSGDELISELKNNNVIILEDDGVDLGDGFYLIGRKDRSFRTRKEAQLLTDGVDKDKYIIMLDHQPNDYDNEASAGADLVISGHTHGGHIFPAGPFGLLIGANDKVYGSKTRENTTFIVTSGISGWAIPFKTGAKSEIVMIEISKN